MLISACGSQAIHSFLVPVAPLKILNEAGCYFLTSNLVKCHHCSQLNDINY